MKTSFPDYGRGELIEIETKLSSKNKKIIQDYVNFCSTTAGRKKLEKIKRVLIQVYDIVETDLDKIKEEQVINFLGVLNQSNRAGWTKHEIKVYLKKFIKWYYKNYDLANLIKISSKDKQNNLRETDLITSEEFEILIENCNSLRNKCLLTILYESGCRPQEALNLRWSDIKFNEKYVDINFYSYKTKSSRSFPLVKAKEFLWFYKQEFKFKPSDYLFPSPTNKDKPITTTASNKMLRAIAKKSNINKNIWNYLLRHSKLTELYKELPQPTVEKLVGHRDMAHIYSHLSNQTAKDELINKIYHIEDVPVDKVTKMQKQIENLTHQIELVNRVIELNKIQIGMEGEKGKIIPIMGYKVKNKLKSL